MSLAEKARLLKEDFDNVSNKGFDVGYGYGYDDGYDDGTNTGYFIGLEDGKQAEYDAFWDGIQDYGNRVDYQSGFANWASEYIRPKHKITIVNQDSNQYCIFQRCKNLKKIENF